MILCFSGTGNSKYVAKRIANALGDALVNLNDRIKASDTSSIETGERVIIVTPTYAWRIPCATGFGKRSCAAQSRRGLL